MFSRVQTFLSDTLLAACLSNAIWLQQTRFMTALALHHQYDQQITIETLFKVCHKCWGCQWWNKELRERRKTGPIRGCNQCLVCRVCKVTWPICPIWPQDSEPVGEDTCLMGRVGVVSALIWPFLSIRMHPLLREYGEKQHYRSLKWI